MRKYYNLTTGMRKNCTVLQIADMLEEEEAVIQEIYDIALKSAPDYNADQIMQQLKKRKN